MRLYVMQCMLCGLSTTELHTNTAKMAYNFTRSVLLTEVLRRDEVAFTLYRRALGLDRILNCARECQRSNSKQWTDQHCSMVD